MQPFIMMASPAPILSLAPSSHKSATINDSPDTAAVLMRSGTTSGDDYGGTAGRTIASTGSVAGDLTMAKLMTTMIGGRGPAVRKQTSSFSPNRIVLSSEVRCDERLLAAISRYVCSVMLQTGFKFNTICSCIFLFVQFVHGTCSGHTLHCRLYQRKIMFHSFVHRFLISRCCNRITSFGFLCLKCNNSVLFYFGEVVKSKMGCCWNAPVSASTSDIGYAATYSMQPLAARWCCHTSVHGHTDVYLPISMCLQASRKVHA